MNIAPLPPGLEIIYQDPDPSEFSPTEEEWELYMLGEDPHADVPFKELEELAHDERLRFERVLISAIENYISLGGTRQDLDDIIDDMIR